MFIFNSQGMYTKMYHCNNNVYDQRCLKDETQSEATTHKGK